jgi:hypothetical protein
MLVNKLVNKKTVNALIKTLSELGFLGFKGL